MRAFTVLAAAALVTLSLRSALAWDEKGHAIVGAIASHYLTPAVKFRAPMAANAREGRGIAEAMRAVCHLVDTRGAKGPTYTTALTLDRSPIRAA